MDDQTINTVIAAGAEVLRAEIGSDVSVGEPRKVPNSATSNDITALITFAGEIDGVVAIGMSRKDAGATIAHMMSDASAADDTGMVESGVAELANMVAGRVHGLLAEQDIVCEVSSPIVVHGKGATVKTTKTRRVAVPMSLETGCLELSISLWESAAAIRKQKAGFVSPEAGWDDDSAWDD